MYNFFQTHILGIDVIRSWLHSNTIIATLVDEVGHDDVIDVHCVKPTNSQYRLHVTAGLSHYPSVFWTQLTPYGALTAVALFKMSSNHILVPFMTFKDHKGGSLI